MVRGQYIQNIISNNLKFSTFENIWWKMENVGVRSKKNLMTSYLTCLTYIYYKKKNNLNGIFFIKNDSIKNITESQILSNSWKLK